jgi:hypothetical protein
VPTLLLRRNVLLRGFTGFVLYLLLPLTMSWSQFVGQVGSEVKVYSCC